MMHKRIGVATVCILAACPASAADVKVSSKIDAVTVFPSGAEVTRKFKLKLEAGDHTLLVDDITGEATASSVRVEAADGKLEIGSVDARQVKLSVSDPAVAQSAQKKIDDQIEKLQDQRSTQNDVIEVATAQENYLDNLVKLPSQPSPNGTQQAPATPASQADWRNILGVIGEGMAETRKTKAAARLKQREIDRSIEDLKKERARIGGDARTHTEARIFVSVPAAIEAEFSLRYQAPTASWTPSYDARLTTGDAEKNPIALSITRRASISQTTGEDWDNIALSLSSVRPGAATSAPKPKMLSVDFDPDAKTVMIFPTADSGSDKAKKDIGFASATAFQRVYPIPGRMTIKATNEAKRLQMGSEGIEPALMVRTNPRVDSAAYLYARLTLPKTSAPLLPGQVSLFRDGAPVGTGQLPQLSPGEEHELGFGLDERLKVKRVVVENKKSDSGTFVMVDVRRYAIVLKNLHTRPIDVQVIDRAPVALHQDIKVDFNVDKGPEPAEKDAFDRRGTYLWKLKAEPDEEKQIVFGYRVTAPAGKQLMYREPTNEELQTKK